MVIGSYCVRLVKNLVSVTATATTTSRGLETRVHQQQIVQLLLKLQEPKTSATRRTRFGSKFWGTELSHLGFLGLFFKLSKASNSSNMSMSDDQQVQRLEQNAQVAESLISEIYLKLADIEKSNNKAGNIDTPELIKLRQENETLRMEVAKWKELLLVREIRNGRNPVVKSTPIQKCQSASPGLKQVGSNQKSNNGGKKEKSPIPRPASVLKPTHTTKANVPSSAASVTSPSNNKEVKKDKKLAFANDSKNDAPAGADETVDVSKLDFRIGLIVECDRHPDADSLYVEKIDLGEDKPRTIISGLVKHVPIDEMRNRLVVVLTNLKPAKMRGILSEGMVMCASSPEKVEILIPPNGSAPGDLVEVEGYPRNPETVLNPKKKIFETVQPDLKTNDKKEATYKGKLWTVPGKGVVITSSLTQTMIK